MPRKRRNEIIAGLFIVISSSLLILLLILMGSFNTLFHAYKEVEVIFEDVQGLRPGDQVFFLGQKVGVVKGLAFRIYDEELETEPGRRKHFSMSRVLVTLKIPDKEWSLLKRDSPVFVDRTITGNLRVLIKEGRSNEYLHTIQEKVQLRGTVSFDFDDTSQKLTNAIEKTNRMLTEITALMEQIRETGHIQKILGDIAETSDGLRKASGPVVKKIDEIAAQIEGMLKENREQVKTTMDSIAESSKAFQDFMEKRLDPAVQSVEQALKTTKETLESLQGIVGRNRSRIDEIVRALSVAAVNAETLSAEIRRRPWRLLYEPSADEVETLGIYDAAWAYNLSAAALKMSLQELNALARSKQPLADGALQEAIDVVEANLKRQRETEEAFYGMLKEKVVR